jgi:hypothetical protein
MTMDERIEAAARAHNPFAFEEMEGEPGSTAREEARREANALIRAAFPELFTDPPTAWIAPIASETPKRG